MSKYICINNCNEMKDENGIQKHCTFKNIEEYNKMLEDYGGGCYCGNTPKLEEITDEDIGEPGDWIGGGVCPINSQMYHSKPKKVSMIEPSERNKYTCSCCGTNISVKYMINGKPYCNKCYFKVV